MQSESGESKRAQNSRVRYRRVHQYFAGINTKDNILTFVYDDADLMAWDLVSLKPIVSPDPGGCAWSALSAPRLIGPDGSHSCKRNWARSGRCLTWASLTSTGPTNCSSARACSQRRTGKPEAPIATVSASLMTVDCRPFSLRADAFKVAWLCRDRSLRYVCWQRAGDADNGSHRVSADPASVSAVAVD